MFECFNNEKEWQRYRSASLDSIGPCADCLPEYQEKMHKQHRCRHPETKFRLNADGLIDGYRSQTELNGDRCKVYRILANAEKYGKAYVFIISGKVTSVPESKTPIKYDKFIGVYTPDATLSDVLNDLRSA